MRDIKKKVLITEFYTSANHGDEAILLGMAKAITTENPNADITVSCAYPQTTERMTGIKSVSPLLSVFGRKELLKVPFFLFGLFFAPQSNWFKKKFPVIKNYLESDIIVCSGGGFLNDNYHPAILARLITLYTAKKLGKPVIIYSASIGPFARKGYRKLARFVFNKMDHITPRDLPSVKMLKDLNVDKAPITLVADSAFSLVDNSMEEKRVNSSQEGKKKITISVRNWAHFENGSQEDYEMAIVGLVNKLVQDGKYLIYFVSSCTGTDGYRQDDRKTAKKIYEALSDKTGVTLVNDDLGAKELIALYKTVDLNIGTRMHTNIFSLIAGTPIIGIRYEDKTIGLVQQFGITEYLVDIEDVTAEQLIQKVEAVFENEMVIREKIQAQLPVQKQNSHIPAKLIAEMTEVKN
jgi:colanic acid/amylovoran biosynthesis protein